MWPNVKTIMIFVFCFTIGASRESHTLLSNFIAIAKQALYLPAMLKDARNGLRKLLICIFMLESTGIDHTFAIMMVASRWLP